MKKVIYYIAIYLSCFTFFTGVFVSLFHLFYPGTDILFYRGIINLGISSIATLAGILFFFRSGRIHAIESWIAALSLAISINLSVFIVFPVTFDRSLSMFMLTTLHENRDTACHGLTKDQLENELVQTYIKSRQAILKRVDEQSVVGAIQNNNGCYLTTGRADRLLFFSTIVKKLYNIR